MIFTGALTDHAAIGYNEDSVFIIGGAKADGNITNEVWLYDTIFQQYKQKSSMPEPRYRFGAALFNSESLFLLFFL